MTIPRLFFSLLTTMVLMIPLAGDASNLAIIPTTTLSAETSDNTSAANNFLTQTNGNVGASNISKVNVHSLLYPAAQTKVFAHLLLWFGQSNHMNVGYSSIDPAQVKRQISDMVSRGIDGVVMVWYGQNTRTDQAAMLVMREAELYPGFTFAIMVDNGAIRWHSCTGCNPQSALVSDLQYIEQTYFSSPAYLKVAGRPVVSNFDIDLYYKVDWSAAKAALTTNPLFLFQNGAGFSHVESDGAYSWDAATSTDYGMSYLTKFYGTGMVSPGEQTWGAAYKGFNDSLASWGLNRAMGQQCGQTWLQTFSKINSLYDSTNQLPAMQLVTWNDYEEGTEIESGIDNCVSISAAVSSDTLQWNVIGNQDTIDHYTIYVSADGLNLMRLEDIGAYSHTIDMCSYSLPSGNYTLFVQAIGKPNLRNHITAAVQYAPDCSPPATPAVTVFVPGITVSSPSNGGTMGSPVAFVASATTTSCLRGVASMGIYINDQLDYVVKGTSLNTKLILKPGSYKTVVQQWDYCGGSTFTIVPITVTSLAGVWVTRPVNNATVSSPVRFTATATSTCPKGVAAMGIYTAPSPTSRVYTVKAASLDTSLSLIPGTHNTVVEEWDYCGNATFTPVKIVVAK